MNIINLPQDIILYISEFINNTKSFELFRHSCTDILNLVSFSRIYYKGSLIEHINYVNKLKHGENIIYSQYPNVKTLRKYKYGKLYGIVNYYYNGVLQKQINYKNNMRHGKMKSYDEYGNFISYENYFNGHVHGKQTLYNKNGKIVYKLLYNMGKLNGKQTFNYMNGNIKYKKEYINGLENGKQYDFFDNNNNTITSICNYINGKKEDYQYYFYKDTTIIGKVINYKNNLKHGKAFIFNENQEVKSIISYINNKLNGPYYEFTNSKVMYVKNYKDDMLHGVQQDFIKNENKLYYYNVFIMFIE